MKYFFLICGLLITGFVSAQTDDFSRFERKTIIPISGITTAKVVRFQSAADYGQNTVLLNQEGTVISHSWNKKDEKIQQKNYLVASVSSEFEGSKNALIDGDFKTSFTFSPVQEGAKTATFSFPKKSEISGILIRLDNNVLPPSKMSVRADFGDGKLLPLLDSIPFSSRLSFSKIFVTRIEVSFDTPHFLRINEIQLLSQEEVLKKDELIFFAEEGQPYTLYSHAHFGHQYFSPEVYQPLHVDNKTPLFDMPSSQDNNSFNKDFDGDGLSDAIDLCPKIKDSQNTDIDKNGRGDLCEDPDLDAILSYEDNCPFIHNPQQQDQDLDKVGDKCDTEENRTTENSPYLLWGIFGFIALILGFLVVKSFPKQKNT